MATSPTHRLHARSSTDRILRVLGRIAFVLVLCLITAACTLRGTSTGATDSPAAGSGEIAAAQATEPTVATAATPNTQVVVTEDSSATSPPDDATSVTGLESPLAPFVPYPWHDEQAALVFSLEREHERNRITVECMQELGFEYVPVASPGGEIDLTRFSPEWAERYGFGVSTLHFAQSHVGSDLLGYPDDHLNGELADPNLDHLAGLGPEEYVAWTTALSGSGFVEGSGGCTGEAFARTEQANAVFAEFNEELWALEDQIQADPRTLAYHEQVDACVAEAGFDWDNSQEPFYYFADRLQDLGPDASELPIVDWDALTDAEVEALVATMYALSDQDRAILAEIQAEEVELAAVVAGCGGTQELENEALRAIRFEHEQQFVDQHADRLAAFARN